MKHPDGPLGFGELPPSTLPGGGSGELVSELVARKFQGVWLGVLAWASRPKSRPKCLNQCNDFSSNRKALGVGVQLFQALGNF